MSREIKKIGELPCCPGGMTRVRQPSIRIPQLVEEGLDHSINGRQSLGRRVLKKGGNEVDGVVGRFPEYLDIISWGTGTEELAIYLIERVRLDLWELVLHVVRVHCPNLVPSRSAKNLDDLNQLVDSRFAREQRLPKHQLCHDATGGPDIFKTN